MSCATMPESIDEIVEEGLILNISSINDIATSNLENENVKSAPGYKPNSEGFSFNGQNAHLFGLLDEYPKGNPSVSYSFWINSPKEQVYDKAIINIGSRNYNDRNGVILMKDRRIKFVGEGNDWISVYKLPLNQWTHIVVKKIGTQISLYSNGSLVESGKLAKATALKSSLFSIGSSGRDEFLNAFLDDIYIFNRPLKRLEVKFLSQM